MTGWSSPSGTTITRRAPGGRCGGCPPRVGTRSGSTPVLHATTTGSPSGPGPTQGTAPLSVRSGSGNGGATGVNAAAPTSPGAAQTTERSQRERARVLAGCGPAPGRRRAATAATASSRAAPGSSSRPSWPGRSGRGGRPRPRAGRRSGAATSSPNTSPRSTPCSTTGSAPWARSSVDSTEGRRGRPRTGITAGAAAAGHQGSARHHPDGRVARPSRPPAGPRPQRRRRPPPGRRNSPGHAVAPRPGQGRPEPARGSRRR